MEYLDDEYLTDFVDEISQNEGTSKLTTFSKTKGRRTAAKQASMATGSSNTTNRSKRSYPYRCKKCGKRFVYKEVYEAHMRIHKGLPGFS